MTVFRLEQLGKGAFFMRNFRVEDTIIYEDNEVLLCHKPAGIAVQNARLGAMDLESALRNYLASGSAGSEKYIGKIPYLAVIHRLDQPVEGVLVFAKTPNAARELSRQMSAGEINKKYLAVTARVSGYKKEQFLKDFLKKDGKTNSSSVVPGGTPGSKEARLSYKVLQETADERTDSGKRFLVEIHLETGRHHQIRVQMSHAGMPLLGDRKYNPEDQSNLPLGLCSCELTFIHPEKKKKMKFEISPLGEAFEGFDLSL